MGTRLLSPQPGEELLYDYIIKSGRAFFLPVLKGMCQRRFAAASSGLNLNRDRLVERHTALPYIPSPKGEKKLPVVLSQEEVSSFFENLPNLKHRALIMTAYATGIRVSEVVSLRVADIDSGRMMIRIELGKGRKDRYVMLSPNLLELLRTYWKVARPSDCLFHGQRRGTHLLPRESSRSVSARALPRA
jgi:integrase